jgi:methionyl-tRNA formyltransferase
MNLGLLVSGNLGFLILKYLIIKYEIQFVLTDSKSDSIIDFCKQNDVSLFVGNPRNGNAYEFCRQKEIDILISVNYLFIIERDLITLPKSFAFNVHGSLLPKYRGRTPHVWAIINNESKTGITAHLIDEGCDTGDIIEQIEIEIGSNDTGADLLNRFNETYIILLENVLTKFRSGNLNVTKQNNEYATYFDKRTPEDGQINWNWQKERIFNWIRAQAYPYPGAFTLMNGKKLIIDGIKFSEIGYINQMPNGMLLSVNPILVKTPNGVVELCKIRTYDFELRKNSVFE